MRKLWRTHFKDIGWNSVGASGFGCIKIVDCTRNHFGSDILRATSLFSTRCWEQSSRVELHEKATSCFRIIGLRIFEDFLTVITKIIKQFLIFSRIPMVLKEIMVAMCNGSGTRCVNHGKEWGFN